MAAEDSGPSSTPTLSSSDDEDDYGDREFGRCQTFIDFQNDDSIPNLTVKTFLRDCYQHPKILLHKEFEFFRSYLRDVGLKLEIAPNAPILENHEDNRFCIDKADKWLENLKERVNNRNVNDFYWASIIPVRRRDDLGLVMFKWEALPMSVDWLQMYIAYCRSNSQIVDSDTDEVLGQDMEDVDDYIKDFLKKFKSDRNMEVEERFKGSKEASEYRKQNNLKGPSKTDLLYLFKRQPKQPTERRGRPNVAFLPRAAKKRYLSDHESDSSTSSDSSSGSEYNGKYTPKGHRKRKKRKVVQAKVKQDSKEVIRSRRMRYTGSIPLPLPANGVVNGIRILDIKIILQRCSVPTRLNGVIQSSADIPVPKASFPAAVSAPSASTSKNGDEGTSTMPSIAFNVIQKKQAVTTVNGSNAKENVAVPKKPSTDTAPNSSNAKENLVINVQANANTPKSPIKSPKKFGSKSPSKFYCEICWFGKFFQTQKLLDRHMDTIHSSKKREMITCPCGLRINKASMELHQRFCKKVVKNGVSKVGGMK